MLNRVKHVAVDDDKSVSAWVSDLIVTSLKERDEYEAARKGALNDLNKRLRLGGTRLAMTSDAVFSRGRFTTSSAAFATASCVSR